MSPSEQTVLSGSHDANQVRSKPGAPSALHYVVVERYGPTRRAIQGKTVILIGHSRVQSSVGPTAALNHVRDISRCSIRSNSCSLVKDLRWFYHS